MAFYDLYKEMCNRSPAFSKWSRWMMYNMFALVIREPVWRFMNYGYDNSENDGESPLLDEEDEDHRYSIQLYHHLLKEVNMEKKRVLEVGCGRGGGSEYIRKYFDSEHVTGLDFSRRAISFCRRNNSADRLKFITGDAENMPFDDESFDILVNVESSHCYNSMKRFLEQVKRVLSDGGYFLMTDFRDIAHVDLLLKDIQESGLILRSSKDITPAVCKALETDNDARLALINKGVPGFLLPLFKEFAGVKGSLIHRKFNENQTRYMSFVLQKAFA